MVRGRGVMSLDFLDYKRLSQLAACPVDEGTEQGRPAVLGRKRDGKGILLVEEISRRGNDIRTSFYPGLPYSKLMRKIFEETLDSNLLLLT